MSNIVFSPNQKRVTVDGIVYFFRYHPLAKCQQDCDQIALENCVGHCSMMQRADGMSGVWKKLQNHNKPTKPTKWE